MARRYPLHVFSNPTNSKSPGPFIVRLLHPKMICRLFKAGSPHELTDATDHIMSFKHCRLQTLEIFDDASEKEIDAALVNMAEWIKHQPEVTSYLQEPHGIVISGTLPGKKYYTGE